MAVIKVEFQQDVKVEMAISQIRAIVQTILRVLPPGIFPLKIIKYDTSSVPILQLGPSSESLYFKARAALDRVLGSSLEANGISFEDAYQGRVPK